MTYDRTPCAEFFFVLIDLTQLPHSPSVSIKQRLDVEKIMRKSEQKQKQEQRSRSQCINVSLPPILQERNKTKEQNQQHQQKQQHHHRLTTSKTIKT